MPALVPVNRLLCLFIKWKLDALSFYAAPANYYIIFIITRSVSADKRHGVVAAQCWSRASRRYKSHVPAIGKHLGVLAGNALVNELKADSNPLYRGVERRFSDKAFLIKFYSKVEASFHRRNFAAKLMAV